MRSLTSATRFRTGLDAKPGKSRSGRKWISGIAGLVMALSLTACSGSDASSATTTSTLQIAPPTTAEQETTTATPSTTTTTSTTEAAPSTTVAVTTAPPTTTVEDQLNAAIDRAQTAMRNCYKVAPGCDDDELEAAFVGVQLAGFRERSADSTSFENVDGLTWTASGVPTLKGDDLAIAAFCAFDPMVVTYPDGRVDNQAYYFKQEWHLVPVGNTWKLSEIVNQNEPTTDSSACDG